jgi:DeoR/GlpR family transcriptional regulator of sugar metabolism
MIQVERQMEILNLLKRDSLVRVDSLAERFDVSTNTIRRDLRAMEGQGLLQLTHGGAIATNHLQMGQTIGARADDHLDQKQRIGAAAAGMVKDGATILLDAGTTTEHVARALPMDARLTALTNGLNVAHELMRRPNVTTILIGGMLSSTTYCSAGFLAEEFLSHFEVQQAFLSIGGEKNGSVFNTNVFEVQIKQRMIEAAEQSYVVCTSNKIGAPSLAAFARLQEFAGMVTDRDIDRNGKQELERYGIPVWFC